MIQIFKNKSLIQILFCIVSIAFVSCNIQGNEKISIHNNSESQISYLYDLQHPEATYHLPDELKEISGIFYFKPGKLACVQDEKASIYIFDTEKETIISKIDFGDEGDFEDIAIVENDAYILRSDGHLFKVSDFETNHNEIQKIKTPLSAKNNTEGLFYDRKTNSLLIACKDSPSLKKGKSYAGYKAIYRFNLDKNVMEDEPACLIDFSKIDTTKTQGSISRFFENTSIKLKLTDGSKFYPSGLAIHPVNDDCIYVLSSVGKHMIIINRLGEIMYVIKLDSKLFPQPEGICFSDQGDMYISNEGHIKSGNIQKFIPLKK